MDTSRNSGGDTRRVQAFGFHWFSNSALGIRRTLLITDRVEAAAGPAAEDGMQGGGCSKFAAGIHEEPR
jgi:hypothetical protein